MIYVPHFHLCPFEGKTMKRSSYVFGGVSSAHLKNSWLEYGVHITQALTHTGYFWPIITLSQSH